MTLTDLYETLDKKFDKYKVIEDLGVITIRVKGPINNWILMDLDYIVPAGTVLHFYTMGFIETLFAKRRSIKSRMRH